MKEIALVILKPDGVAKNLLSVVLDRFATLGLDLVALRVRSVSRELAQEHYRHIKETPFFESVITYLQGEYHGQNKVVVMVYQGPEAIRKCRKMAGATDPEDAHPWTIRGALGRITRNNIYENVVHVSSDRKDAEREVRLWLNPDDFLRPVLAEKLTAKEKKRVWK